MSITVELCPVCSTANIAGSKWCYGRSERHEKARFVFVPVVRATLTPERVEDFARFLAADHDPRFVPLWEKKTRAMEKVREDFRRKARVYLQVAGFTERPVSGSHVEEGER